MVNAKPKTNIRFNGRDMQMRMRCRWVSERRMIAMWKTWGSFTPARLAAKLNAKIIVNGNEFNNAGEMSVDDRRLYHEAWEAFLRPILRYPPVIQPKRTARNAR